MSHGVIAEGSKKVRDAPFCDAANLGETRRMAGVAVVNDPGLSVSSGIFSIG